jgi:hypothetical protein
MNARVPCPGCGQPCLFTWPVPADHAATEAEAVLSVRDRSGQDLFRTIRIDVLP